MGVTGKHDVLDVISQLLKPEGLMLENELYIDKMSGHFDHTIQIFYGSPKVCIQVLTVSSNNVAKTIVLRGARPVTKISPADDTQGSIGLFRHVGFFPHDRNRDPQTLAE